MKQEFIIVESPKLKAEVDTVCINHPRFRKAYERAKARGYERTAERIKRICDGLDAKRE